MRFFIALFTAGLVLACLAFPAGAQAPWTLPDNTGIAAVDIRDSNTIRVAGITTVSLDGTPPGPHGSIFVAEFNAQGVLRWVGQGGVLDPDQEVIISGFLGSHLTGAGDMVYLLHGTQDIFTGGNSYVSAWSDHGEARWQAVRIGPYPLSTSITSDTSGAYAAIAVDGTAYIFKLDRNGSIVRTVTLDVAGESGEGWITEMFADGKGNLYLVGSTPGSFPGFTNAGAHDLFIAKYDRDLNSIWLRQSGTAAFDMAHGIAVGTNGFYVVESVGEFDFQPSGEYILIYYDLDGNEHFRVPVGQGAVITLGQADVIIDVEGTAYVFVRVGDGRQLLKVGLDQQIVWRRDVAAGQSLALNGTTLFLADGSSMLRRYRTDTGEEILPDVVPPQIPEGLTASIDNRRVMLQWEPNAEPDLSHYTVYRGITDGFEPGHPNSIAEILSSEHSYADQTVRPGTPYYYRICAVDVNGNHSGTSAQAVGMAYRRGDLDNTDTIDILDVVGLINTVLGRIPVPPVESIAFMASDVNLDGEIDILDIVRVINVVIGRATEKLTSHISSLMVRLGEAETTGDRHYLIPVEAEVEGDVAGIQLAFSYDPALLQLDIPHPMGLADGMKGEGYVAEGQLRFILFSLGGKYMEDGRGTILQLPVTALSGRPTDITLRGVVAASSAAEPLRVTVGTSRISVAPLPIHFALNANRPNPFNSSTSISYEIPQSAQVKLAIYNLLGQEVVRLVDAKQPAGRYTVVWNGWNVQGMDVASGVYLYRMTTDIGYEQTRRMTLLK